MKLLTFDLGRLMGVAVGDVHSKPLCFTEVLAEPSASQEVRFCQALRVTARLIDKHKPDAVAIEQPIAGGVVGKAARVEQAFGYRGVIYAACEMKRVRPHEFSIGDIRDYMIGERSLKSDKAKARVFEACQSMGWSVTNYEESDAGAVWHLGRNRLFGVTTISGLFGDEIHAG